MSLRSSNRGGWTRSSRSEISNADRFYADLMGLPPLRAGRSWEATGASPSTPQCIRPNREAAFTASVTRPTVSSFPHSAICKILVLQRVSRLARFGIVDPNGNPVERPDDRPSGQDPPGPWGSVTAPITGLLQGEGTGFFIRPDRIVTAAHVVLGAIQVVVIPQKNGPTTVPPTPDEPLGRRILPPSAVHVFPDALSAATHPLKSDDEFFMHDLAVLHLAPFGTPPGSPPIGDFHPAAPPTVGMCVNTSGYSAETLDRNFQHTDVGVCIRRCGSLVDFDLMSEKGASGSPIWPGPFVPSGTSVPACGIVLGGVTRNHTFSLVFDSAKLAFLSH